MTPTRTRWRTSVPIAHYQKGTKRIYAIPVRTILKHCGDFATNYGSRRDQCVPPSLTRHRCVVCAGKMLLPLRRIEHHRRSFGSVFVSDTPMTKWSGGSSLCLGAALSRPTIRLSPGRHFASFPPIIAKPPQQGSGSFLPGGRPPVNVLRKGGRSPNGPT